MSHMRHSFLIGNSHFSKMVAMRAVAVIRITIGWLGIMDRPSFLTCLDNFWH